ncbi:uncharacterized protein LOC127129571 [Lathyrus oleraceus]|uniref:uncharacterized protein LOC127129571 n=1 Tax=Pisum sativum TaxID=3888 RepID=UPI0021D3C8EE|nr:uncharacterized protein LOC127129571 [Pisum sativum]
MANTNEKDSYNTKPPVFDGEKIDYWKDRFESFFLGYNVDLWDIVINGYEPPISAIENTDVRLRQLSKESRLSDNSFEVRTHWNRFLRWITSEVFKLKGLSEQVKNDYIRGAEERMEARLAQEAEERAREEAEERTRREAEERVVAEVDVEAKAKADVEEVARIATEEAAKTYKVALTRGDSPTYDLALLVLKTLHELKKEQQLVRSRLDQQDQVNSGIQNLLAQLLQRMPPPNP